MANRHITRWAKAAAFTGVLLGILNVAAAVSTRLFELDDFASLSAGDLDGTAVHSDGTVTLGLETRRVALKDVSLAYSLVQTASGVTYVGTGNEGLIYKLQGDTAAAFAKTKQLLVSTMTLGPGGTLYAGTLPEGRIYQVAANGEAKEFVRPKDAAHVWSLVYDAKRHRFFAATGPNGVIFSIDEKGHSEVYYDSDAAHVMSLALDEQGALYAGTSDQALVLKVTGPGRAEVVYDFPGNEVTSLSFHKGELAVAANDFGGSAPAMPLFKTPEGRVSTGRDKPAPVRTQPGKGKVFRVGADGRVEQVYQNDESHVTTLQLDADGAIFAGLGKNGRIVRIARDRTSAVVSDVDERQVLALDLIGPSKVFVTGDGAAIYRVLRDAPKAATWTSKVLDAKFASRWGQLEWRGSGAFKFQTRSGNTDKPDKTWTDWSAPLSSPGPIRSPGARFLQIRAQFPRDSRATLRAVSAYYLPQNQRALISDVGFKGASRDSFSLLKESGSESAAESEPHKGGPKHKIAWKVDNPDGDRLRYRVRFRGESQSSWRDVVPAHEKLTSSEYTWDTSSVPDGYYVLEVDASDELSNPATLAVHTSSLSEPVLVDNHAPTVESLKWTGNRVSGAVRDLASVIQKLEYAVDGGEWQPFFPTDGFLDTRAEAFNLALEGKEAAALIVAVRATDAAGNTVSKEISRVATAAKR